MRILAGDIGGTKTLLQIAEVEGTHCKVLQEQRYDSRAYDDLAPMVSEFLHQAGKDAVAGLASACFGVAGPVSGERARLTNLPWQLDARQLAEQLGIARVCLINDFQAVGYGIEALAADDIHELQQGQEQPHAPRVLIGAGTGLGEGILVWQQDHYEALASEGGHVGFAPEDATQVALLQYLRERFERVSYNLILCGPGLVNIYQFLRDTGVARESAALNKALAASDPAAVVTRFALEANEPLAVKALDLFIAIYGAQAGNLALTCIATGGAYVAGGIAPKIIDRLKGGEFIRAFNDKGRMSHVTQTIPVRVVLNPRVGLMGAALSAGRL